MHNYKEKRIRVKKLALLCFVTVLLQNNYAMSMQIPTNNSPQACEVLCPKASASCTATYKACCGNFYVYYDEHKKGDNFELACCCDFISCCRSEFVCTFCCCCNSCLVSKNNDCGICCGAQFLPIPFLATAECIGSLIKIMCPPCFEKSIIVQTDASQEINQSSEVISVASQV